MVTNAVIFRWPGLRKSPFSPKKAFPGQRGVGQLVLAPCKFKVLGSDQAQSWRGMGLRRESSASSPDVAQSALTLQGGPQAQSCAMTCSQTQGLVLSSSGHLPAPLQSPAAPAFPFH